MNKQGGILKMQYAAQNSAARANRMQITKELCKAGTKPAAIAFQIGVSENTVKQYIRELKPLIEAELKYEKLQEKFNKKTEEINNSANPRNKQEIKKFMKKYAEAVSIASDITLAAHEIGLETDELVKSNLEFANVGFGIIYSTIPQSLNLTINDKKNKKLYEIKEEINKVLKKYLNLKEEERFLKEDYEEFKVKINTIKTENDIDLLDLIYKIEKTVDLDKQLTTYTELIEEPINNLGKNIEDLPTKGMFWKISPAWGMFWLNLLIPGFGTLMYNRNKINRVIIGIIQLILILTPIRIISWIWAIIQVIAWRKNI